MRKRSSAATPSVPASSVPNSLAEILQTSSPGEPLFESLPERMREDGRVAGFEALRDMLLRDWRSLAAEFEIPLPQLLKLVLDTDRHALFAALSEEKMGDANEAKVKRIRAFQDWLQTGNLKSLSEIIPERETKGNDSGRDQDVQG